MENPPGQKALGGFEKDSGSDLLSHAVTRKVPSALEGLTTVFEMGTGEHLRNYHRKGLKVVPSKVHSDLGQVLDLLVPASSMHCCTSTSGLSTN